MFSGLSVPRHATFGSRSFYRPATGGWKSWSRTRLGGVVGTPSAGWASGGMWWPLVHCGVLAQAGHSEISLISSLVAWSHNLRST